MSGGVGVKGERQKAGGVPEGWQKQPLESVSHIQTGLAKGKTGLKSPVKRPFLRVANVQDARFELVDVHEIELEASQVERFNLKFGDVVITEGGDADKLGRGHIWRNEIPDCVHQNHLFAIRANQEFLDPEYLSFLISSQYGKSYFLSCAKQSTNLASINSTQLKAFPVLLPPLPEQRKIAAILSTWDDSLATLTNLLAAKRQQKRGLAEALLTGKKRLPGFAGEWEEKKLGELVRLTAGATPSTTKKEYWGGTIPWMASGDIHKKRVEDVAGRITELGLQSSSTKMIPKNSVLVALAGQGKTRGTVATNLIELCTNQSIASLIPANELNYEYLYYNLDSRYEELRSLSTGDGGRGGLNLGILGNISLPVPPLPEQQAIASILSTLDGEIAALEALKAKVQEQKRGLMDELLTGRVRVKLEELC